MVFFTCNACGASLKKNQVEKHYQSECRNCNVLSCMDCGKDFFGEEYAAHTKCISEAEKYQGALFKQTGGCSGASKGEKKQQQWLDRLKESSSTVKVSPKIASLLEKIAEYPNVPRKKKKFENFVRNSVNVRDEKTLSQLWDIFDEASKAPPPTNGDVVTPPHTDKATKTNPAIENEPTETKNETTQQVPQDDRIKKKKSKKLKQLTDSEDPIVCDVLNDVSMDSETAGKKKKKSKDGDLISKPKRKHIISDDTEELDRRTKKRKIEN